MTSLEEIKQPILEQLKEFEAYYLQTLNSNEKSVTKVLKYLHKTGGKKMRPLFVLLCASLHGKITKESYISATIIEMMHTASLIHDDIVDESYSRRGFFSVNALWGSKKAVLIGDYILSVSLKLAIDNHYFKIIEIISDVMKDMSLGEILQSESAEDLNFSEERYYEVIRCKTGVLLGACAEAGAVSAGASEEDVEALAKFGTMLGLAFQIKDDILDYNTTNITGKPSLNDIREKKMTLPLILSLQNSTREEQKTVLKWLRKVDSDRENVTNVYNFVMSKKGLDMASEKMETLKNEALLMLERYEDSEYKTALVNYSNFILERKK
ncbi:MAG: polyprenyl synthetase family protein [Rikenellaceae bacterium]